MKFVVKIIIIAFTVFAIAQYALLPGISVSSFQDAFIFSIVLGILNILVKPLLFILTLPITLITFGLFTFVLNALLFLFASSLVSGVAVSGLLPAFLASLIVSAVSWLVSKVL